MADEEHDEHEHDDDQDDEQRAPDDQADDEVEQIRSDPAAALKTITSLRGESMEYRRKLRKAEAELERLKREGLSEQERAVAEAEARGRQTALAEHGRKLLEAQVLAAAAGKLQDPGDAVRYLDLDGLLDLDDDERELDRLIAKLVEEKPYLAVVDNGEKPKVGVRSQGPRTRPGEPRAADVDGSAWLRKAARRR